METGISNSTFTCINNYKDNPVEGEVLAEYVFLGEHIKVVYQEETKDV